MAFGLFLNSVPELNLSFYSEYLYGNLNQISILVLWLLLLLFIFFVGIPSIPNFWKNEHTEKRQGRSKRRRKGGTRKGLRYHHREEEEERELISFLKSPLGQNHDTILFRQLLCPDPSCEVCNNATAEIQQFWECANQSVSPVASTAAVTEPSSFTQSSAFSAVPPGVLISPPLLEASPPPPSILSSNPMNPLGNSLSPAPSGQTLPPESPSPSGQTLPPEPSPLPSESEFPGRHYPHQPKTFFSSNLPKFHFSQGFLALHPTKTSLGGDPAAKLIDPRHKLLLSPEEHDSGQPNFHPNISEEHLQQKLIQLFWGLPTLHSESLPSSVRVTSDYFSVFLFNTITEGFIGQESPGRYFSPPSLPEVQPQCLPQTLHQTQEINLLGCNEGQFPGTVPSSQHSIKQTSSVKSHTELKQTSVPSSVGGNYGLNTSKALAFLGRDAQQMLEAHMITFHQKMLRNLPTKVPESKYTASSSLIERNHVSSTKLISEVNTNSAAFTPRRSSESLHGDRAGTKNSAADLTLPLPDTPHVGKADFQHPLREDILKAKLSLRPVIKAFNGNTEAPKLPARQTETRYEISTNTVNCNERMEIRQGTKREKSEHAPMPDVSREIVRAEGIDYLQPRTSDILITRKPGLSQMNKESTVTMTKNPVSKISVPNPNISELRTQLIAELNVKLKRQYSKAGGQSIDMSPDEDNLTHKSCLARGQGVSRVDTGVSLVLHVQSEDRVNMKKQEEPWLPKHMMRTCQDTNSPPAVEKAGPGSTSHDVGAEDAGLREKRIPSQGTTLEDRPRSKSPQTRSQQGQVPPDSLFLNKMSFFQRINPKINGKTQENAQQKGTSCAWSRGPVQSRAAYTGTAHIHRVRSDPGKLPEDREGCRHAIATTWPQAPLPAAAQFGKAPQKGAVQAPAGPVHGPPINSRAPSKSGPQAAILAGQTSTNSRKEDIQAHKAGALKGQHSVHQCPLSVPCTGTVPYSSPTWRPQATKGPLTVLTTAEGTVFRDQHGQLRYNASQEVLGGSAVFPIPK